MTDLQMTTLSGATAAIAEDALQKINGGLRGSALTAADGDYEKARAIWNAMIDRRPAMIARCAGPADVINAVTFARDHNLLLAVHGAGHNIAGNAVCDGGLMLDLSAMKSVRVDPKRRTAWVEPGVILGEFDHEAQAFGLATPLGINSTTGISGLTLGGGFGWISRKFGMTIDNLVAADVVTVDGDLVRASADENPDLFWAIRGGGGNFGVVTAFEFGLHPIGPEVMSGLLVHPFERAPELLRRYREVTAEAPDELTCYALLRKAPPLPFLPAEVHGTEVLVFGACYAGPMDEGERAMAPLRALGEPIADAIAPHTFTHWQSAFDPLLEPGARNYWKSHDFKDLSDALLDTVVDYAGRLPTPECEIFIAHLGGAIGRVPVDATAYPHRDAEFLVNIHTRWRDPAQDDECIGWARALFEAAKPMATGGVYVNFMPDDEADRVDGAYGANRQRLAALKAKYDPGNLFRLNQNIQPAP
jgi:FAD/FMN-containing dehydrogenase